MKTAEEKKELRDKAIGLWKESKEWGDEAQIKALVMTIESQLKTQGMSHRNVALVAMQMENLGLQGVPYLHTRTYGAWKEAGRQVKKGEKSLLFSITWIGGKSDDSDEEGNSRLYPKMTNLFHFDQTEAIGEASDELPPVAPLPERSTEANPRATRKAKGKTAGLAVIQQGLEVSENREKGGIEIRFAEKPEPEVLNNLKSKGFRWGRSAGCWYAPMRDDTKAFAYSLQV
ncbi:MAG: hypothetical protein ACRC62_19105 [Microcoleus sp.]